MSRGKSTRVLLLFGSASCLRKVYASGSGKKKLRCTSIKLFCRQDIVMFVASWCRHVFNHFQQFVCCGMVLVTSEVSQDLDIYCL